MRTNKTCRHKSPQGSVFLPKVPPFMIIYAFMPPPSPTRMHLPPKTNKLETALPVPKNFKLPQVCESPPLTTLQLEAKPGKCDSYESYTKRYST